MDPIWIEEATGEFGVSRSTLQRYLRQGKLSELAAKSQTDRKVYLDREELAKVFGAEGFVVVKRAAPDQSARSRHPGGRPIGTGKSPKKR